MLYSPKSPHFKMLRQRVHENQLLRVGHRKNKILGETPVNMTWIEDFPCLICDFLYIITLFLSWALTISTQIWKNFFFITHTHVVQDHPGMNEFCSNALFQFWVFVVFQCEKLSCKSVRIISFLGVISIQTKTFPLMRITTWVYKSEDLYTVSWEYAEFSSVGDFMLRL